MTFWRPTWLLTARAVVQFPRNPAVLAFSLAPPLVQILLFGEVFSRISKLENFPVDNYYTYLTPGVVFFTTVIGIANAGTALVVDFQNRYMYKLLLAPINMWSILMGRLLSDGVRVYLTAALIFLVGLALGADLKTGPAGFLLILLLSTLFSIFTVGVVVVNVAIRTKDQQATQAIFPIFFILIFLTTAFMPKDFIDSDIVRGIITANPAEYVVAPLHSLMYEGYAWNEIGLALAITAAFAIVGVVLTRLNFRSVYK